MAPPQKRPASLTPERHRSLYAGGVPWPGAVYYFRWPTVPFLVKIGWGLNVRTRLRAHAWDGRVPELLAAEPSPDRKLELERHRKFAHLQVMPIDGPECGRTEVFMRDDELDEWLAKVRDCHRGWQYQTNVRGAPQANRAKAALR